MNKLFLQRVFNSTSGQVYVYSGTGSIAEITEKFVLAAGNNLLNTIVVELSQFGTTVVYTDVEVTVNSPEFQFFTDLVPDVLPPEPEPTPPVIEPTTPEPEPTPPEQGI